MINLLNIRITILSLFRVFIHASGCAHVAWSWHKLSQAKSELPRNEALTVELLQLQDPHHHCQD